jgi:uncharacterized MAPEG superfamily protein
MTSELTVLALSVFLQLGQFGLAAWSMNRDVGIAYNASPRDQPADFSTLTGRLRRAVDNHFEAMALFTVAVVVVTMSGAAGPLTATCAWIYLAARILYVPAYALGWSPWRSAIYIVGATATSVMILAALLG